MPHGEAAHAHFPGWGRYAEAAFPLAVATATSLKHHALVPPGWPALAAFAAALPWVLELVGKRLPWWASASVVLAAVGALVANPTDVDIAPFFLIILTVHTTIADTTRAGMLVGAASIALMVAVELLSWYDGAFVWIFAIVLSWGGAWAVATQLELIDQLRTAQRDLAERAAADERRRIAREIHDVVAHSLAVTMLHLTGARMALRRDPQDAEAALLKAESLGRESLAEIRRAVGLLDPEMAGTAAAMPTAADIAQLVREFESAGLDVHLEITGDVRAVSPATGLGVYRIAQESLANIVKHAPGALASMHLAVGDDAVHLRIRSSNGVPVAAAARTGGHGLRGMVERATSLGGTLSAGPDESGWCVDAALPRTLEPA